MEGENNKYIFAYNFLACELNLMLQTKNVADYHKGNVTYIEDVLDLLEVVVAMIWTGSDSCHLGCDSNHLHKKLLEESSLQS